MHWVSLRKNQADERSQSTPEIYPWNLVERKGDRHSFYYPFFSHNFLRLNAVFFPHFFKQTFLWAHFSSQTHPQRQWFNHFSLQKDLSRQYKFKIPKRKGMPSEPIWGWKIIYLTSYKGFLSVHATKKWRHRKPPRKISAIWMKQVVTCALY